MEVKITSISNCDDNLPAASPIFLKGTYSSDLTDKELWILAYAPDANYYTQSANACGDQTAQLADGQWQEVIWLGRPDVSEAFHLVAVVTDIDSPASEAFHNHLKNGCRGDWGNIPLIPPGATELDSIIVHTR